MYFSSTVQGQMPPPIPRANVNCGSLQHGYRTDVYAAASNVQ